MAAVKQYGYQLRGKQIAILEKDFDGDADGLNYSYDSSDGVQLRGGGGVWKSPITTVADGLEIEYVYSPQYFINETDKVGTQIDTYVSTDGLLKLIDQGDNDYSASPESLSDGSYIVLRDSGKWNGLHRVKAAGTGYITLYTKCSDSSTVQQEFEETPSLYYNINQLDSETDELDIPRYLANAVVYYVKAKYAEDAGELEMREFFMREFRRTTEKHQSGRQMGSRIIQGFPLIR